ncbi:MAG: hypothetical protein V3T86_08755 [Planctomycetota bacterium]
MTRTGRGRTFRFGKRLWRAATLSLVLLGAVACVDGSGRERAAAQATSSCMLCHNGSKVTDYAGPGIANPHPFPGAGEIACTTCHGGNPDGDGKSDSHVPPPPEIGDRQNLIDNNHAYFNRLTLTGIDKFPDYQVDGKDYTSLEYLQFINPGDLRVVTQAKGCGQCHQSHADCVAGSPLATEAGILSGALYAAGADSKLAANTGHENTESDMAFRAVADGSFDPAIVGAVASLLEFPVYSGRFDTSPDTLRNNDAFNVANVNLQQNADGTVQTGSELAKLYHEQIAFTCGDCHLGSAGANNRYGDFRSSGCTACHMPYSLDGRSRSSDPNVNKDEPADPDQIREPERSHVRAHQIVSVAKTLSNGHELKGMDDYTCAGCHQGSNRTVMQFWGIRLDQNEDLHNGHQYPAMPKEYRNTRNDTRLFDPDVGNRTFNGRRDRQYILYEDYDRDDRDDTPPDVHYEAGMGCIDCHGSFDLHGGDVNDADKKRITSRMEQSVAIACESCHGGVTGYATTQQGTAYDGTTKELAVDAGGRVLKHVVKEADGNFYLYSRLTGKRHYLPQTHDTVVNNQKRNPFTDQPVFTRAASYSMGRDDDNTATGLGPQQSGAATGFSHTDNMNCVSCHASWTNTCMGCHLKGEYDGGGNNFSNITGERIVFEEDEAQFVYQSPIFFQLGVNARNKITQVSSNTKMFFQWEDRNNDLSKIFAFSDRNGNGNKNPFAAMGHNAMMAHSIRGRVTQTDEGPRYCVACHNTTEGLAEFGDKYDEFRAAMSTHQYDQLNFDDLAEHFGRNTGNHKNSPLWVHGVAGLGTGLFLFDENGCAVNPLDNNDRRYGCFDEDLNPVSPASLFVQETFLPRVMFNLDRIVDESGVAQASSNHALLKPGEGPNLRGNTTANPNLAGPLSAELVNKLTNPDTAQGGIVLDGWLDSNGVAKGTADPVINPPPPE